MGRFSGYRCDGPNCGNRVDEKEPEARRWLQVRVSTDDYNEDFTFCSYECLTSHAREVVESQFASHEQ